jgi:osmotically-inducible protein OsmY
MEANMKTDARIQKDVTDELRWNPNVSDAHIGTKVQNGVVTLTGDIPHYIEKSAAEEAVQRVSGVRAVVNQLEVKLPDSCERSDQQIAEMVLNILKWCYRASEDIKVSVNKGVVTLKGDVEWDYQRSTAKNAVSSLMGVNAVEDKIQIKPQVRFALSCEVHSSNEGEDAFLAAWVAPYVATVKNNIRISA